MADMAQTFPLLGQDSSLCPEEIDRELAAMWKPADQAGDDGPSVTRVVLGNVIWMGAVENSARVRRVLEKVVPNFPCRMFVLEYDPNDTGEEVRASINAQCFVPEGGRGPVCCETIAFRFGPQSVHHVRGCVAPLLLPDLRTLLWAAPEAVELQAYGDLEEHVDRIIFSASSAKDPAEVLERSRQSDVPATDLAWYRLASIRDQVVAFFDDSDVSFDLQAVESVSLLTGRPEGGSHLPELMGALFVGWLGSRLGWKQGSPDAEECYLETPSGRTAVRITGCQVPADGQDTVISTIEMTSRQGEMFRLTMKPGGEEMEICTGDEGPHRSARHLFLSELNEVQALGMALNSHTGNKGYREAAALAAPVLKHYCG